MAGGSPFEKDLDPLKQIRHVAGHLRRGWFTLFTLGMLGLLIGLSLFFFLPKSYTSTAKVLLRGTWMFGGGGEVRVLEQIPMAMRARLLEDELRSTSWIEAVLDKLEWKDWAKAKLNPDTRTAYTGRVKSKIDAQVSTGETGERLIFIHWSSTDRMLARDFVEALRDHWLHETQDSFERALDADVAERLASAREKEEVLRKARQDLQEYETRHGITTLFLGADRSARRNSLSTQLDVLLGDISGLEAKQDELEEYLRETGEDGKLKIPQYLTEIEEIQNETYAAALAEITTATNAIEALKAKSYTDRHPSVIQARLTLSEALRRVEEGGDVAEALAVSGKKVPNELWNEIDKEIRDTKLEIARLKARQTQYEKDLARIEDEMEVLPVLSAELERYKSFIVTQQKIVDQARIELEPLLDVQKALRRPGPERLKPYSHLEQPQAAPSAQATVGWIALVASLVIGLGLALAIILGREFLKTSFSNSDQARRTLQLPVLGEVALIMTELEVRRARLQRSLQLAASLTLLAAIGVSIYVCLAHGDLLPVGLVEWADGIREGLS